MADTKTLQAAPRSVTGKKVADLRRAGLTPVVVYGPGIAPAHLQTNTKALIRELHLARPGDRFDLEVEGEAKPRSVVLQDVQQHVTKLTPLHVDFLQR